MLTRIVNRVLRSLFPEWQQRRQDAQQRVKTVSEFQEVLKRKSNLEGVVAAHLEAKYFLLEQKPQEILALCRLLERESPETVLEIGGRRGGSISLYSRVAAPNAKLLSVDIGYTDKRRLTIEALAVKQRQIHCIQADSHKPETLELVQNWFGGQAIDFLFIDGDHSYEGVKKDFEMFAPLVKPNGIIALHDIVPDYFTRYGTKTENDVGEVPRYWKELLEKEYIVEEFVQDINQDGYGIGVIHWMRTKS